MATKIASTAKENEDLHNRLMILEKFIELKSNECAYYRTKVHLMQMNSFPTSSRQQKRSSSEETSHSLEHRHRSNSLPLSPQERSILKKQNLNVPHLSNPSIPFDHSNKSKYQPFLSSTSRARKENHDEIYAQNQNYYEELNPRLKEKSSPATTSPPLSKDQIEQILISYLNKHVQQSIAQDKTIQCNANDFHSIKTPPAVLVIRLPHQFVKSLITQQKKPTKPKLKVHLSSQLLQKLFQSIHFNSKPSQSNQFTIQSQFGQINAWINPEHSYDQEPSKAIHAQVEMKTHHEGRASITRHIARTRSDSSNRNRIIAEKNHPTHTQKHRRKKRHLHKLSSTSYEESIRSSLTNVT